MLAPPRPWWRRRCFATATLIAIALNGSRPALNCARMGGKGAGWVCTPFAPRQTRFAQTIAVLAPLCPWRGRGHLAAALLITICHNGSRPAVNGKRIGGGNSGLVLRYNNQLVEKTQTIYRPGWRLGKEDKGEGEEEVNFWLPSFGAAAMAFILEVTQQSTHGGAEI